MTSNHASYGWLVVLRIYFALAVFQPYRDLEAGDNQSQTRILPLPLRRGVVECTKLHIIQQNIRQKEQIFLVREL